MKNLRRILELAKRTGDRFIVADPDGEDAFVVMGLDQYEGLLGTDPTIPPISKGRVATKPAISPLERGSMRGSEDGIDGPRLRQDRDLRPPKPKEDDAPPPDLFDLMKPANEAGDTWDIEKMTDGEREDVLRQFMAYQGQEADEPAPKGGTNRNEAKNDPFDEDQFYLEPVE